MKRTLATMGVVGLGLISLTAPAMAASDQVVVCHRDGSTLTQMAFDANGIGGHAQHTEDIIPPTPKLPAGMNWTNAGKIAYVSQCGAQLPPGEVIDPVDGNPGGTDNTGGTDTTDNGTDTTGGTDTTDNGTDTTGVTSVTADKAPVAPAAAVPVQQAPAKQPAAVANTTPKAAPVPVSVGTNQGYNAQTAVGAPDSLPGWLAGLGALAAAGAAVAVRRQTRPHTDG